LVTKCIVNFTFLADKHDEDPSVTSALSSRGSKPLRLFGLAIASLLGPITLRRLFERVGSRPIITGCNGLSCHYSDILVMAHNVQKACTIRSILVRCAPSPWCSSFNGFRRGRKERSGQRRLYSHDM
jgi:hypothetical protein